MDGFKQLEPEEYQPPGTGGSCAPEFNPFAALGMDPATATVEMVIPAWKSALRHVHKSRVGTGSIHFPTQS